MASFVRLSRLDPYQLFVSTLREARPVMRLAYDSAFQAFTRRNDLVMESLRSQLDDQASFELDLTGSSWHTPRRTQDPRRLHAEAQVMDLQADQFASLVVCFGDDAIQRFRRAVLGGDSAMRPGFGPTYFGERLTTLLRVGSNAFRHVSEWDDMFTTLPYPDISDVKPGTSEYRALQNIEVIQRMFGIGKHELIRDPISWRVIVTIDGQYGTAEPSYERFEQALIQAARDIARIAGGDAASLLENELARENTAELQIQ